MRINVLSEYFKWVISRWFFWLMIVFSSVINYVHNPNFSIIWLMHIFLASFLRMFLFFFLIWGLMKSEKDIYKKGYFWFVAFLLSIIGIIGYIFGYVGSIISPLFSSFMWTVIAYLILFGLIGLYEKIKLYRKIFKK